MLNWCSRHDFGVMGCSVGLPCSSVRPGLMRPSLTRFSYSLRTAIYMAACVFTRILSVSSGIMPAFILASRSRFNMPTPLGPLKQIGSSFLDPPLLLGLNWWADSRGPHPSSTAPAPANSSGGSGRFEVGVGSQSSKRKAPSFPVLGRIGGRVQSLHVWGHASHTCHPCLGARVSSEPATLSIE